MSTASWATKMQMLRGAVGLELRLLPRQNVRVDAEPVRDLAHGTALPGHLLHGLDLELTAVPSTETTHRVINLVEPRDSKLGVHFFGATSASRF
jgi:hypothetical protein